MMKAVHILFAFLGVLPAALNAQNPPIEWQASLGGSQMDIGHAIRQTTDGGYLVVGQTASDNGQVTYNHGNMDGWTVRLGWDGSLIDQRTYGGSQTDNLLGMCITVDEGSLLIGFTNSTDGDASGLHGASRDAWVVKVDSIGSIQWQRCLGGISGDEAYSAFQVPDGGYLITGPANSNDGDVSGHHGLSTMSDAWVIKLDGTGALLWEHSFGGTSTDRTYSIIPTADGGSILAGETRSSDGDVTGLHGQNDAWVVKLDSDGNLEWQRAYGGSGMDMANAIMQMPDGGFAVAGSSGSNDGDVRGSHGGIDAWVLRLDASGAILWQRALGGSSSDVFNAIELAWDGGLILAGQTNSNNGNVGQLHGAQDAWVVKLDNNGTMLWQKTMGGSMNDAFLDIITTPDGGHVLTGRSASSDGDATGNAGSDDLWVVRLASQVGIQEQGMEHLGIWPNPSQGRVHINTDLSYHGPFRLVLSDAIGRIVGDRTLHLGVRETDFGRQAPGLYLLRLYDGSSVRRGRLIME